jgi:hypothetical protein
MFGKRKESSGTKQKRRWFFKVDTIADAEEAIKISYQTFYTLAAIQAVVFFALYIFFNGSALNLIDPIIILVLAWFIHHKKSRSAAVILGFYTVIIAIITLANKIEMNSGLNRGGRNIVLVAIALYAIYKGLQGTFKYHRFRREQDPAYGTVRRWVYFMWVPIGLVGVLVSFGVFVVLTGPSLNVITGEELAPSDLAVIRAEGIVEPDEQISLFYSAGVFSIREDGNLITDKRVISYQEIENEMWMMSATFVELEEVVIEESGGFFSDSVLLVTLVDGTQFRLFVSAGDGGDSHFLNELKRRMVDPSR